MFSSNGGPLITLRGTGAGAEMAQVAAGVMAAAIPIHAAIGPRATAHLSSEERPSPLSLRTKFSKQKRATPKAGLTQAELGVCSFPES